MSPTEYNSSSPCWCTDAFMEQLRCTWWKVAHKQPTASVVNTCGPPVSRRWSFCGIEWTVMVVGVLVLRACRPGICCQTVFVTQLWVLAFSGVTWKHFFAKYWRDMLSALQIFFNEDILYKFTVYTLLTYLLSVEILPCNITDRQTVRDIPITAELTGCKNEHLSTLKIHILPFISTPVCKNNCWNQKHTFTINIICSIKHKRYLNINYLSQKLPKINRKLMYRG